MPRFSAKRYAARRLRDRLLDWKYIGLSRADVGPEMTDSQLDRVNEHLANLISPLLPRLRKLAQDENEGG